MMEAQEKSLMPILGQSAFPRFYLWILREKNFLFCHTQIKGPGNANLPTQRIFVILRKRVNTQKEVVHACSAVSNSFRPCGLSPIRLLHQWNFSGKNTGMGCHFLLQGIFPDPRIKSASPVFPSLAGRFFTTEPLGKLTQKAAEE